jgi:O-methyltransferase
MLNKLVNSALAPFGIKVERIPRQIGADHVPDRDLYRPRFSPWFGEGEFARYYAVAAPRTIVSRESCFVLWTLIRQALNVPGDFWECGVYKGGTAAMVAAVLRDSKSRKKLLLFDTFQGMPDTDPGRDWHKAGDFGDTSAEAVTEYVGGGDLCNIHQGFMPDTFRGLESSSIAFAHLDVDIYKSIYDCLKFIWPRLTVGGVIVCDDYGLITCPGARAAVDDFFATEVCVPLCLSTGQAVIFKGSAEGL